MDMTKIRKYPIGNNSVFLADSEFDAERRY